jgi:hypothetical protein
LGAGGRLDGHARLFFCRDQILSHSRMITSFVNDGVTSDQLVNPLTDPKLDHVPALAPTAGRLLTAEAFQRLAEVPPEIEWCADLGSKATWRAYENAL